jgi:hypothetical protein
MPLIILLEQYSGMINPPGSVQVALTTNQAFQVNEFLIAAAHEHGFTMNPRSLKPQSKSKNWSHWIRRHAETLRLDMETPRVYLYSG